MGRPQKAPGKQQILKYRSRGLSQWQIAEQWFIDTGIRVSRSTIAMAAQRYGIDWKKAGPQVG